MRIGTFNHDFAYAASVDVGRKRSSNQDEVILCPEKGFFAVSDGMGGLPHGGDTSELIRQVLPSMMSDAASGLGNSDRAEKSAGLLKKQVQILSDKIHGCNRSDKRPDFGATLSGVWLVDDYAVFVNMGDSRAYLLPRCKRRVRQVTKDHNLAAILVEMNELSKEEAANHPSSSQLTRFMGMPAPAQPEVFVEKVKPGDRVLLCSDGLYGMIEEGQLCSLLRSSKSGDVLCRRLVDAANDNGGRDNISVVYLKVN
jgi:serine/threonine protein phosphatase PrpC